jgi:hypothetical protein
MELAEIAFNRREMNEHEPVLRVKIASCTRGPFTLLDLRCPKGSPRSMARRKLLAGGVVLAGSAASAVSPTASAGAADDNLPPHAPAWMKEQGAPFLSPPYGQPSPFEKNVIRRPRAPTPTNTAASSMTPWQNLHGITTPNGLHFEGITPECRRSIRISIG